MAQAEADMNDRAKNMISRTEGEYLLKAGRSGETLIGNYSFKRLSATSGELREAAEDGESIGRFTYESASVDPRWLAEILKWGEDAVPCAENRCIGVTSSEIIKKIQDPSSSGAYFVLPSQLNGAEYPSETAIVRLMNNYKSDNTGGPRGQLAVHPGAGQFVIDNAANSENPKGINAVDELLAKVPALSLQNGYLKLPCGKSEEEAAKCYEAVVGALHTLRPLMMHEVMAKGLKPNKQGLADKTHRVGLVYASAVPVDSYLNFASNSLERKLHGKIAEGVLIMQYYSALRTVALQNKAEVSPKVSPTKVFLMPLGGGVFNNPWQSIARAMSQAMELLAREPELFERVEVDALAWEGDPSEQSKLERLLTQNNKYIDRNSLLVTLPDAPLMRPVVVVATPGVEQTKVVLPVTRPVVEPIEVVPRLVVEPMNLLPPRPGDVEPAPPYIIPILVLLCAGPFIMLASILAFAGSTESNYKVQEVTWPLAAGLVAGLAGLAAGYQARRWNWAPVLRHPLLMAGP